MTSYELYTKDARVWIPHSENVWEGAVVTQPFKKGDELIYLKTDNNNVTKEIKIKGDNDLPHLRNPPILIGQNDLTALSYLHEPDVLYNLQIRFCERQAIYTYCGIVLVAINPYAELPLYGQDMIQAYRGHSMGELEPHIFAIAEDAYTKLEREKCDLSIIVSGESGAGKTVSAKYAMRYFAAVGGSESETQIERKVLASSPIMEAIGNAKTTRNDNSSRFGKFTKLLFTSEMSLMSLTGATMQTYLLEKSRVVFQAPGERNYHIFYQLCAARDQWPELMLDHQNNFRYLNQGESPDIAKISDLEQFTETISALTTLGFTDDEIKDIVKILAGILHLGNIQFTFKHKEGTGEIDQEESETAPNDLHLGILSELLQLDYSDLKKWLTIRQIESVNELVYIPINRETAEAARDALGKHIYAKLFQYIVEIINKSLITGKKQHGFIGVLDIYGFETFDINSFEQFCINYANEKLQQQFNQHVFKLEQEEYLKEGIVWTMIDFYDNQPCIDLIETKLGILDLLDEECRMPRGSDESWAGKLMEKCTKYQHFEKPRFGNTAFLVKHFSDTVKYEVQGFLEKNRDTVSKELVNVLRESGMPLCRKLMDLTDGIDNVTRDTKSPSVKVVISASKVQATPSKQHKQTVGSQFRESLSLLINTLHSTTPHYVRCIKPNEDKYAFKWEPSKIVQQLRACGVLETVRISAAGFPSRWSYDDFYARYRLLCKRAQIVDWNVKATCVNIVRNLIKDEDKFRYGNTQIFFRAGQVAFLEQIRSDLRKKYIIVIQSLVRRFIYHRRYMKLKKSILGIQRYARGLMARRKAEKMRRNRAAITLQRHIRGWLCRQRFLKIRQSILGIQTYARGLLARRTFKVVLDNYKAIQIQRYCRGYLARLEFQKKKQMIIKCQAAIRKFLARRLFKRMKTEARTVAHIQKMYKGLENKIISMQQKMDEVNKENAALKVKTAEIPELRSKVDVMKNMENELKSLRAEVKQKDELLIIKSKELVKEQDEKMSLLEEKHKAELEHAQQKMILEKENEELSKQLSELMEKANKEAIVTSRLARQLSEADVNELHQAYQKTITEKESLEKLNYILKEEVNRLNKLIQNSKSYITHSRSISNASSQNDEDFGYSSAKNTLELKREFTSTPNHVPDLDKNDKMDFVSYGHNITPDSMEKTTNSEVITVVTSPTSGNNPTALILRLRKLLEEEKNRSESLQRRITRIENKNKSTMSTVDSIKMSELEVENEKIRQDYQLLRNSIKRGVEHQEMEAQYLSIQEELKRRRDECIQLRAVLANQSQSLRSLGSTQFRNDTDRLHDSSELMEAFQAQKLVNRQLESELTALTVENNAKIEELNHLIDDLRNERNKFQTILEDKLNVDHSENNPNNIIKKQSEIYLRHELEKTMTDYVSLQEKMNEMVKKLNELMKINNILTNRLRDHGLNDSIILNEEMQNMVTVKKKAQVYQGIFKYRHEDESKILQRLINDFKPRVAITLLPGLPAYIVFMCIRYTDLVNTDQHVRTLLTNFVIQVKKLYKLPKPTDYRVLWMVNTLKLNNLLKQYGGIDEFINLNTETQNQQQLKNFDLSEYRQVIYETIINIYFMLVRQIQELIKGYIVPAILDHDEMARGKGNRGRAMSLDMPPSDQQNISLTEPKSLVNQLEHYYKQLQYFGLDDCYIEQIIKQLMYYICTISMNNLMLRQELCMWKTGMKIRYNVGCLEEWVRKNKMSGEVVKPLQPLIEVSSLLQSRKSEEDVQSIYELCPSLTTAQVLKIIKSYTLDDYENAIKPIFIEKLTHKLNERQQSTGNDTFTMDENFVHPLNVVYKYSEIKLEDIELPSILNLDGLLTKI